MERPKALQFQAKPPEVIRGLHPIPFWDDRRFGLSKGD
jgi:hypothetical protein